MKQTFALAAALLLASASVQAADIAAGKAKAEAQCADCHAANNDWNKPVDPSYPKLAGQHKDYLAHALKEYQSGGRKNAIMAGMAAALSRDDIDNLTAYFASLNGDLYLRK